MNSILKKFGEKNFNIKKFTSSDGYEILAGRDEASNDHLTFKVGRPNDLWFHVKGESGSHVILRCSHVTFTPARQNQQQAASIAAWFSKMRKGGKVAVSVCRVKDVSKPRKAVQGLVKIHRAKTLMVKPELPDS
ncbi:MAG: NFACT RNA binding domain-containing protein [bacterium]